MGKLLSFRLEQCFGPFTMLFFAENSETGLFRIYLITFLGVGKVKNTSAIRFIFSLKIFKIESRLSKCAKRIGKKCFVSEIIASEDVAINCQYKEQNTCHRQSMC